MPLRRSPQMANTSDTATSSSVGKYAMVSKTDLWFYRAWFGVLIVCLCAGLVLARIESGRSAGVALKAPAPATGPAVPFATPPTTVKCAATSAQRFCLRALLPWSWLDRVAASSGEAWISPVDLAARYCGCSCDLQCSRGQIINTSSIAGASTVRHWARSITTCYFDRVHDMMKLATTCAGGGTCEAECYKPLVVESQ
jgi:hypothetical protein